MLRKCRPNQVLGPTIELADIARDGVQYNWSLYILNQFNEDYIAAQVEPTIPLRMALDFDQIHWLEGAKTRIILEYKFELPRGSLCESMGDIRCQETRC